MGTGLYLKTWTGTVNGVPPDSGGGGGGVSYSFTVCDVHLIYQGFVTNLVARNFTLDRVSLPIHLYQTNGGHSYVTISVLQEFVGNTLRHN